MFVNDTIKISLLTNDLINLSNLLKQSKCDLETLRNKIRKIRDTKGDDRCWKDFEELYVLLPEGYTPPKTDTLVELENCREFIKSCNDPNVIYVSPQRRIEELEQQVKELQEKLSSELRPIWLKQECIDQDYFITVEISKYSSKLITIQELRTLIYENQFDHDTKLLNDVKLYLAEFDRGHWTEKYMERHMWSLLQGLEPDRTKSSD